MTVREVLEAAPRGSICLPRARADAAAPLAYLVAAASGPYRRASRFAYGFARGKLAGDPVFRFILEMGLLLGRHHILDLGCGQGLLAAWLGAAVHCHQLGIWPRGWPAAPQPQCVRGIEMMSRDVERARRALGSSFDVRQGDIRGAAFGTADAVVVLDVLHYLPERSQCDALRRIRAALSTAGLLLLRVADADAGLRFRTTQGVDKIVMLARGHGLHRTHCRGLRAWRELLAECGFDSVPVWMSHGTPFANVLLIAHAR